MEAGQARRTGKRLLQVTVAAGAIFAAIVGIARLLLQPDPVARSDVADLVVTARPQEAPGTEFVLPLSAALEDFPGGDHGPGCSSDDLAWLRQAGRERLPAFSVSLRNGATSGGALRVSDIRADGTRRVVGEPVVVVSCAGTRADGDLQARVDTDDTASGVLLEPAGGTRSFEVELPPGAERTVQVALDGLLDFRGSLRARVVADRRSEFVQLPVGDLPELDRAGLGRAPAVTVEVVAGGEQRFACVAGDVREPCSPAGIRARAARLWERPDAAVAALSAELGRYDCSDSTRQRSAFDQVWRGFYPAEPPRTDRGFGPLVTDPVRRIAAECGREYALAALDGTALGATGAVTDLRAVLAQEPPPDAGAQAPPSPRPADCSEDSVRAAADESGTQTLAERREDGGYVYDQFRVHACGPPYALVEASQGGAGYAFTWLLEAVAERWVIRASASVGEATPPERSLWTCGSLANDGVDVDAMRAALGTDRAADGPPICS